MLLQWGNSELIV